MTSNHRILPTAASFGWTDIAAAADPLRSTDEVKAYSLNCKMYERAGGNQHEIAVFIFGEEPVARIV